MRVTLSLRLTEGRGRKTTALNYCRGNGMTGGSLLCHWKLKASCLNWKRSCPPDRCEDLRCPLKPRHLPTLSKKRDKINLQKELGDLFLRRKALRPGNSRIVEGMGEHLPLGLGCLSCTSVPDMKLCIVAEEIPWRTQVKLNPAWAKLVIATFWASNTNTGLHRQLLLLP